MALTKVADVTAATKLAIANKSASTLPDRPSDTGLKAATIKLRLYAPITDTTNSVLAEIDRIVTAINASLTEQDSSNAAKVNISVMDGAAGQTPIITTHFPSSLKLAEYVAAEILKILNGTYPLTVGNIDGDLDVTGSVVIHTNLQVMGTSNLVSLTITGDDVDVNDNKIMNLANGTAAADAVNFSQLDARLSKAGGTMTGAIAMGNYKVTGVGNGSADGDAVNIGQLTASMATKIDLTQKAAANGVATLDASGKVPSSQMGSYAITNTFEVASQVAMLALSTAETGDVAVRSDENKSYILGGTGTYSTIGDWILLKTPTDTVLSVNGETGVVVLDASEIAYSNVSSGLTAITVQAAIDEVDSDLDTAQTDINTLQSDLDIAEAAIDAVEAEQAVLEGNIAAITLVNANEIYARIEPQGDLTKASPTAAVAHKTANLNEIDIDGNTMKEYIKDSNLAQAVTHPFYTASNATVSYRHNEARILATAQNGALYQAVATAVSGHVYYVAIDIKTDSASVKVNFVGFTDTTQVACTADSAWHTYGYVKTANATTIRINAVDTRASAWTQHSIRQTHVYDLTELGTHSTGVHWHDMSAATVATYLGKYAFTGTTGGLHSNTLDEAHLNSATPNTVEIKRISGRTVKSVAPNGNFSVASTEGWVATGGASTLSIVDGQLRNTISSVQTYNAIQTPYVFAAGAKYYVRYYITAFRTHTPVINIGGVITLTGQTATAGVKTLIKAVVTAVSAVTILAFYDNGNATTEADIGDTTDYDDITVINLTELGVAHLTTTAEVEAYFGITGYVPFGLTNSIPTAVVTSLASYAVAKSEWPTDQQTYGIPCLPCGICDYIDGHTSIYWRNVGIALFDGDGGESWSYVASLTLTASFELLNAFPNSLLVYTDTTTALFNGFVQKDGADVEYARCRASATTAVVNILKSRITGWADGDDAATKATKFKAWLASNILQVQYYRTATDHALTSTTISTFRVNSATTDTISITGALNPTTCFDIGDYYSHYTSLSTVGANMSLPDGTKDNFVSYVDKTANSATFQQRVTKRTNRALKIDLPSSAVTDGWALVDNKQEINGEFEANYTDWITSNIGTPAIAGGAVVFTATAEAGYLRREVTAISGHVYCAVASVAVAYGGAKNAAVSLKINNIYGYHSESDGTELLKCQATASGTTVYVSIYDSNADTWSAISAYYVRVYDLTAIYGAGNEPASANFATYLTAYADFTLALNVATWRGTHALTLPIDNDSIANAHTSSLVYQLDDYNDHIQSLLAGLSITSAGVMHLTLPVATADTLAELYTYLIANPLSVIVPITAETTTPTTIYIPQSGDNALTLSLKSSTVALEGDFSAIYCKDLNAVLAAL